MYYLEIITKNIGRLLKSLFVLWSAAFFCLYFLVGLIPIVSLVHAFVLVAMSDGQPMPPSYWHFWKGVITFLGVAGPLIVGPTLATVLTGTTGEATGRPAVILVCLALFITGAAFGFHYTGFLFEIFAFLFIVGNGPLV